jgi:hypothetical protein
MIVITRCMDLQLPLIALNTAVEVRRALCLMSDNICHALDIS